MTITLTPNQVPNGTLPGSPTKIIDVHTDSSNTRATLSIPIPISAQPGDFVGVFFGLGYTAGTGLITGFTQIGPQFSTANWGPPGLHTASGAAALCFLWRIVQPGDPGKSSEWRWSQGNWMTWSIFSYTLRFVHTGSPIQVQGAGAQADNVNNGTSTGDLSPTINNVLMIGAIEASAGVTTGINPGPTPAWIEQAGTGPAPTSAQPAAGMVSGALDQPLAGQWLGAGCLWAGGSPSGNLFVSYAGLVFGIRPPAAPTAPTLQLNPSGGSIDAGGLDGTPFRSSLSYLPVNGQGQLEAWYFGRQPHGGGAVQWWNADRNLWQAGEYANIDVPVVDPFTGINTFTYEWPGGAWADDSTNWDVVGFVREGGLHYKSDPSTTLTFTADPPPAITSVTITNPNSATPTVSWTEALTISPQVGYRVRLFSSDQIALPGFDPTNILIGDDSDFELTTGTWQSLNSGVALSATHNYTGGGDLRLTATTTAGVSALSGSYPVTPGVQYYATGYAWADTTPRAVHLGISWQDIYGNQISTASGTPVTDSTSAWTLLSVSGTAPTGAVTARLTVASTVSAVNEVHRLDQVYWAATPVPRWDSGMVLSTALTTVTGSLTGGLDYTAYVRALQTNDQVTPLKALTNGSYVNNPTASFFNNRANPSVPTLVATPGTVPLTGAPQVNLALSGSATTALVEYSDDQVTWFTVRDGATGTLATAVALAGSPTIYDREAPPGATRYYRATGYTAGQRSDHSAAQAAVAPLGQFWLRRPLTGDGMLLKIETSGGFKVKYPEDATQYPIGGRRNVVTIAEAPIHGAVIAFVAMFTDQGSWDAFKVMREAQETLLLQSDTAGKQWYVRIDPEPEYDLKLTGSRLAGKPRRTLPLVLTEQDRP